MARSYGRLIRGVGMALAAVLLLVLAALAVLVFFVDADAFRPRIERIASQQLGRGVSLGHLQWNIGRRIGLSTKEGSIAHLPGFEGQTLARWQRIGFGLSLWPLLHQEVQIDHLQVEGLVLDLQKNAAGQVSWTIPDAPPQADEGATSIGIESLSLTDSTVRYRDAATGTGWQFASFALEAAFPGGKLDQLASLQNLKLSGLLTGGPRDLQEVMLALEADQLEFDRVQAKIVVPTFRARVEAATIEGSLEGQGGDAPRAKAALKLEVLSLRTLLVKFGVALPPMRDPATLGALSLTAKVDHDAGALMLDTLEMKIDDTQLSGRVSVPRLSPLALRFTLQADRIDLDRYLEPAEFQGDPLELPVAKLKALDAQGTLRIAKARVAGADASDVEIKVQ